MKARAVILLVLLAMMLPALARKGKKPTPSRTRTSAAVSHRRATEVATADTILFPAADSVTVAGYEKTLRSTTESMIITNHTASEVTALGLDITYLDMKGRMLHRVAQSVTPPSGIPSGESRMVSVPSFDRQGLFYYHLSPRPKRASRATPFKVAVKVSYICIPKTLDNQ